MRVLIDGQPVSDDDAVISAFDWGLIRGYGCFEVIRSYGGNAFRVGPHLDRFETSAAALGIELPARADLQAWVETQAAAGGECLVRIYLTAGSRDDLYVSPSRTVVLWEPLPSVPDQLRVLPLVAPWHAAGVFSELTRAKTLSYAPNMATTLVAQAAGYDESLLFSREGWVLEGPTFSICWFRTGALELPPLSLGVLESITRATAVGLAEDLGIEIRETLATVPEVSAADEVAALSTVKEVIPIAAIGDAEIDAGPLTEKLATAFRDLTSQEAG
jgi:branched-chain amino acid aminotransferase